MYLVTWWLKNGGNAMIQNAEQESILLTIIHRNWYSITVLVSSYLEPNEVIVTAVLSWHAQMLEVTWQLVMNL